MKNTDAKGRIHNAALQLIVEKGYENTTTREIVKLAGSSLSRFAQHYESKEKLARDVMADLKVYFDEYFGPTFTEIESQNNISKDNAWKYLVALSESLWNIPEGTNIQKFIKVAAGEIANPSIISDEIYQIMIPYYHIFAKLINAYTRNDKNYEKILLFSVNITSMIFRTATSDLFVQTLIGDQYKDQAHYLADAKEMYYFILKNYMDKIRFGWSVTI